MTSWRRWTRPGRVRAWLDRPRTAVIRTGRSSHEVLVCITAIIIGLTGLLLDQSISPVINEVFPPPYDALYFAGLVASGALTLYGVARYRLEGLLIERIGLSVQAAWFAAYAVAIVGNRGMSGWALACLPLCFAVSNLFRVVQIRRDLAALPAELRATGRPGRDGDRDGGPGGV